MVTFLWDLVVFGTSRASALPLALFLDCSDPAIGGVHNRSEELDARPADQMRLLDEKLNGKIYGLIEFHLSLWLARLLARRIDHRDYFQKTA